MSTILLQSNINTCNWGVEELCLWVGTFDNWNDFSEVGVLSPLHKSISCVWDESPN